MRPGFEAVYRRVESLGGPAVDHAARILADAVRAEAPVVSGTMRDSIAIREHRTEGSDVVASVGLPLHGGHRAENTNTALHVIYGTARTPPNPFLMRGASRVEDRCAALVAGAVSPAIRQGAGR